MMPQRIQLSRAKGWRKPEGVVLVGRPSVWGNPYRGDDAAAMFRAQLTGCLNDPWGQAYDIGIRTIAESLDRLRGHDLACWCPLGVPCHADVLLELANEPEELTLAEGQELHDEDLANHQLDVERDERLLDR